MFDDDDQPLPGRVPDDWDDDEDPDDDGPLDMILDPACWPDDDDEPTIYPGAPETCNGEDDDCDSVADNGLDLPPATGEFFGP